MKKIGSAGPKALLLAIGAAMTPWAPGSAHVVVFGCYAMFVLYPELSPGRWSWVRELLRVVQAFTRRR
jgi:hypothetical protein